VSTRPRAASLGPASASTAVRSRSGTVVVGRGPSGVPEGAAPAPTTCEDLPVTAAPAGSAPEPASTPSTRDRLLEAVIQIAGREGPHVVTHRSVAARAQVTHGLVRHYFGTRQALLEEALELAAVADIDDVRLATDRADDFADGLLGTEGDAWVRRVLQFDIALSAIRGTTDRRLATRPYEQYFAEVAKTLQALGVDDPDGSWSVLLFAAIDGLSIQDALGEAPERTEAALGHLRELLTMLADRAAAGRRSPATTA
jgi:AcrR family transcriptional regulator